MWHPVLDTRIKAIDADLLSTRPGHASQLVQKCIAKDRNIETDKGNLRLTRKNIRTAKVKESDPDSCKKSNEFYVKP